MSATVTPERVEGILRRLCPLYEAIELRVESLGDELAVCVPCTPANGNHLGGVHAAVLWAAAESIGGIAYSAHPELGRCWIAVRSVSIAFLAVARTDVRATATFDRDAVRRVAESLGQRGSATYALDISVTDADGVVVATAVGDYYLRREAIRDGAGGTR